MSLDIVIEKFVRPTGGHVYHISCLSTQRIADQYQAAPPSITSPNQNPRYADRIAKKRHIQMKTRTEFRERNPQRLTRIQNGRSINLLPTTLLLYQNDACLSSVHRTGRGC